MSVNEKIKQLESVIEQYNLQKLHTESIFANMISIKDDIIFETLFKEEYLLLDTCPFEHNGLTYRSWIEDIKKKYNVTFEDGYIVTKDKNGFYKTHQTFNLEELFIVCKEVLKEG